MKQKLLTLILGLISTFSLTAQIVVNTTEDSIKNDNLISLREAIIQANNESGNVVITFDQQVFTDTTVTIALDLALPKITKSNLTIQGINKFTPIKSNTGNDTGLVIAADFVSLKNLAFSNFISYNSDSGYYNLSPAVLVYSGTDFSIDHCFFIENYDAVVFENPITNVQISNSVFYNNAFSVVFGSGASYVNLGPNNRVIHQNYYYNDTAAFFFADSSDHINISGNHFFGSFSDLNSESSVGYQSSDNRLGSSIERLMDVRKTRKIEKSFSKERMTKLSKKETQPRMHELPFFEESTYKQTAKSFRLSDKISKLSEINYSDYVGILINRGKNITIADNNFRGTYTTGYIFDDREVIDQKYNSDIQIVNNTLTDVYQGFIISNADHISVQHNKFDFIYEQILYSEFNSNLDFSNNNSNLYFHDYYGVYAVRSYADSLVSLTKNSVSGFDYFYYGEYSKNIDVFDNILGRMYDNGIYINSSEFIKIRNNSIKYSDDDFIYTNYSNHIEAVNNFVNYSYGATIYSYYDKNVYVAYNRGNYIDYGVAGWFDRDSTVLSEFNNSTWVDCEPIGVEYSYDVEIRNHSFSNTWCEFAWIYRSNNVRFHDNKLESSEDDNIYADEVSNFQIFNNIFANAYYSNNIYFRKYYYENTFPPVDSLIIRKNVFIGAEYDAIYYYDYSYTNNYVSQLRDILIENNKFANGGYSSSGFNFYGYRNATDTTILKLKIRNNDFSHFNNGIVYSGYAKRNTDEFSFTNNNFSNLLYYGIQFNNWNYGNGMDSLTIDAQGNFWGDPSGPFVPDTTSDLLRIANPNGKGYLVSDWVDWRNFKTSPDSPFSGKVFLTSVMPKEFNHTDSLLVRISGYDFSHVNQVFIGKSQTQIINKSANEIQVLAKYIRPGYNKLKFVGNGILDSILNAIYVRNLNPPIPNLIFPLENSNNVDTRPVFLWNAVSDPDGDQVIYRLTVYSDPEMKQKVYSADSDKPQFQHPGFDLTIGETYYWDVVAADIFGWYYPETQKGKFSVSAVNSVGDNDIPTQFGLSQNYPNPFNPVTVIKYQLSATSDVRLVVFDVLGREVTTLVNSRKEAGNYSVPFDASKLSSGIYFYILETSSAGTTTYRSVKQMTFLK